MRTLDTDLAALGVLAGSNSAGAQGTPHHAQTAMPEEPAAQLIVGNPLAGPLARGLVVLPFRTERAQLVPVFGEAAAQVSPRLGHLHIAIDDLSWHWVQASGDPIVIQGLPAGPHKLTIELAEPNHKIVATKSVSFIVP